VGLSNPLVGSRCSAGNLLNLLRKKARRAQQERTSAAGLGPTGGAWIVELGGTHDPTSERR
jgi:hypothetical protein